MGRILRALKIQHIAIVIQIACQTGLANLYAQKHELLLSGQTEATFKVFVRDSARGAAHIPQYDYYLTGGELWSEVRAAYGPWEGLVRFDAFYYSNLPDPSGVFTRQGLGYWHIAHYGQDLKWQVGHIYDQWNQGLLFRTWEERPLGIDNSVIGLRAEWIPVPSVRIVALGGRPQSLFTTYQAFVKGAMGEWTFFKDQLSGLIGAGLVNRTMDATVMSQIVAEINQYPPEERFIPRHNMYATGGWATLTYGPLSVSIEADYRFADAVRAPDGRLRMQDGKAAYAEVGYAQGAVSVIMRGRYLDRFVLAVQPDVQGFNGVLHYVPAFSRMMSFQLPALYMPIPQPYGEQAFQTDLGFHLSEQLWLEMSAAWIDDLQKNKLFRNVYGEVHWEPTLRLRTIFALQYLEYNLERYLVKPGKGIVYAWTLVADLTFRLTEGARATAIKTQWQYMHTRQDQGAWTLAYVEWMRQPGLSLFIQDLWNVQPVHGSPLHYVSGGITLRKDATSFTLAYRQMREGVNCSGGVCRWEPAFNGVQARLVTSF